MILWMINLCKPPIMIDKITHSVMSPFSLGYFTIFKLISHGSVAENTEDTLINNYVANQLISFQSSEPNLWLECVCTSVSLSYFAVQCIDYVFDKFCERLSRHTHTLCFTYFIQENSSIYSNFVTIFHVIFFYILFKILFMFYATK